MGRWKGFLALLTIRCAAAPVSSVVPAGAIGDAEPGAVRRFAFATTSGKVIRSSELRGRMSLIVFAATYDAASQAQARMVQAVFRQHVPRINVLLIALEPPHHKMLVEAFAQSLNLSYPVALADAATIAGRGAFEGLQHVPSLVLLDRQGRERWRHIGLIREEGVRRAIARYDERALSPKTTSAE